MMKPVLALFLGLSVGFVLAGCDLYWGGGDDTCMVGVLYPSYSLRDPSTGQCSTTGGGGGICDCNLTIDQGCAPPSPPGGALNDWAQCYGSCDGLDEAACVQTAGCQAAYLDNVLADLSAPAFLQCWNVAPSGPVEGGGCVNLDASECSRHDDCGMIYTGSSVAAMKFEQCAPEPVTNACDHWDCGSGSHCEQQCYPCDSVDGLPCTNPCQPMCVPDDSCATVDCGVGYTCAIQCDAATQGLVGSCHATCVATDHDPGECYSVVSCDGVAPQCPSGTTPGVSAGCYTGYCIPITECGPKQPGQCYASVTCNAAPPSCPVGTLAGVKNGCWSGYCIPTAQCELAACETLATEVACTARGDCTSVYAGTDCTCTLTSCECQTLTYERCESAIMPL